MKIKTIFSIIIIFFLIQCGSYSDKSTVYVYWNSEETVSKDTYDGDPPDDAKQIIISVYADEVSSGNLIFYETYPRDLDMAEIEVFSGTGRIFVVEATEANSLISYRGISGAVDLVSDETATVIIRMYPVTLETATLNITLRYDGGSFFGLPPSNLNGSSVYLSVITRNSPIFDQPIDDIEIACDTPGDYDNIYSITSDNIPNVLIPARSFVFVVVRGNYDIITARLRYIGLADPIDTSNLEPDSVHDIEINVQDGLIDPFGGLGDANWKEYCKCGT